LTVLATKEEKRKAVAAQSGREAGKAS